MCFYSFNSLIKASMFLWMAGFLVEFGSSGTSTTPAQPCKNEAAVVCKSIGTAEIHQGALTSAFKGSREIDLIFIICNTSECRVAKNHDDAYNQVISFIVRLVSLMSTKYESFIDENRVHISLIVYDDSSVRVALNDIEKEIPTVGNCEFDKFIRNITSSTADMRLNNAICNVPGSLKVANTIFSRSTRRSAKKILWLFSNCHCNGTTDISRWKSDAETAISNIKNGYKTIDVFTTGVSVCPSGWFSTIAQEELMKAIASSNSSHYACIDSWQNFIVLESESDNSTEHWTKIPEDVDIRGSCRDCSNSKSSYRCACQILSQQYGCHKFPDDTDVLAIALGVGIGVGLLVIVIVIVIVIVVVVRRSKTSGSPPPPLPRTGPKKPPAAPPTPKQAIYGNCGTEPIEYEILELERKMPGWSAYLQSVKLGHPLILHLGIYSIEQEYFAQTPGFSLTQPETTMFINAMKTGNSRKNSRKKPDITVGNKTYVIDRRTRQALNAHSTDNTDGLRVVCRDGYIVVGVAKAPGSEDCQEAIRGILTSVTTREV